MSQPLLVPMHVEAKVLQHNTSVPSIAGGPFGANNITLSKGVHLHWAMPSALTTGRTVKAASGEEALIFPGIPDIWMVVRFNPLSGQGDTWNKRDWKAWIIDAANRTVKELKDYTPPSVGSDIPKYIHTTPKLLQRADELFGMPGWGYWEGADFNPAGSIYYPDNVNRFGFYDDLSDTRPLPTLQAEKFSYSVIGWYSRRENDPLAMSKERRKLLGRWKWRDDSIRFPFTQVVSETNKDSTNTPLGGLPLSIMMENIPPHLEAVYREKLSAYSTDLTLSYTLPDSIICHGSVLGVERYNTDSGKPVDIGEKVVRVSSNLKRGLVEATNADLSKHDVMELLMNDMLASVAGDKDIADLQGQTHAATFQGEAGKGKLFFQLDISKPLFVPVPDIRIIPSDAEIIDFGKALKERMSVLKNNVEAERAQRLQDRLIRVVVTTRSPWASSATRQPEVWWMDIENRDALLKLYQQQKPIESINGLSSGNLYEMPGERWYYPGSPHLILTGIGRNHHAGYDTRFDSAGILRCRMAGSILTALNIKYKKYTRMLGRFPHTRKIDVPDHPVLGKDLVNSAVNLAQYSFVPAIVQGVLEECMLLDVVNAPLLGSQWVKQRSPEAIGDSQDVIKYFALAIDSQIFIRKFCPDEAIYRNLKNVPVYTGTLPSPVAVTSWQPAWIPLMVDTEYTYKSYPLSSWKIGRTGEEPLPADMELLNVTGLPGTGGQVFSERNILSSVIPSVWESLFGGAKSTDGQGKVGPKTAPLKGVDSTISMDILSTALVGFDGHLDKLKLRERAGTLKINKIRVIDIFGETADLSAPSSLPSNWWMLLPPRLPYWSRLQFRLTSARNDDKDATDTDSPLCGYLLPDLVEHSVEVYDDNGKALGQVVGDAPVWGLAQEPGKKLRSRFVPLPWIATENPSPGDLAVISNPHLRELVAGLVAQVTDVPTQPPRGVAGGDVFSETALTAFMRMLETMRLTVDSSTPVGQWKLRFVGEPVAVIRARMWAEATPEKNPKKLRQNPEIWGANENLPTLQVKVGDETRPNDGVLGCFIPNQNAALSRFTCTSNFAISNAILKDLSKQASDNVENNDKEPVTMRPITHPFFLMQSNANDPVKEEAVFSLKVADKPVHLTLLQDLHGGVFITSGVLPRKQITISPEFIKQSEDSLMPSVQAGPIMAIHKGDGLSLIPPMSKIGKYSLEWMQKSKDKFTADKILENPPVGAVPFERVLFSSGWLVLTEDKE